jgi:hypothetical protein
MTSANKPAELKGLESVAAEFEGVELGDVRRSDRLLSLVTAFAAAPGRSIPKIARDEAELQAFYRLLSSDKFTTDDMLEPHAHATVGRAAECKTALAIHDVSEVSYSFGETLRDGLARRGNRQGFFCMAALAVAGDGTARPLGVLGFETWTKNTRQAKGEGKKRKPTSSGRVPVERWASSIARAEELVSGRASLIHVADREASVFELFSKELEGGRRFVIRLMKNRCVRLENEDDETAGTSSSTMLSRACFRRAPSFSGIAARRARVGLPGSLSRPCPFSYRARATRLRRCRSHSL